MTITAGRDESLEAKRAAQEFASAGWVRPCLLSVRSLLRGAARAVFAPYELNRVYALPLTRKCTHVTTAGTELRPILDPDTLGLHPDPAIRRTGSYAGPGAWGYGAWVDGSLAAVCWTWSQARCRSMIVDLAKDERALVDIYVLPAHRGHGLAPALLAFAAADAAQAGCSSLHAWIWWTNAASIRAFEKCGWTYRGIVFSLTLFGRTISRRRPALRRH